MRVIVLSNYFKDASPKKSDIQTSQKKIQIPPQTSKDTSLECPQD